MKIRKIVKRLFLTVFLLLVLLVGALFAIPYFFKDEVLATVRQELNANLNATVDFKDVHLSLIRDFPRLCLQLEDFSVMGIEPFEGVELVSGETFEVALNIMSVIKADRPIEVHSIHLEAPRIHVLVLENGQANYDIAKPTPEPTTEEAMPPLQVELASYSLANGRLIYDDRVQGMYVEALGLDHSGKGDFTLEVYDFSTLTAIDSLTVESGGIRYLRNAAVDLDATLQADLPNMKFTLKENALQVNALQLEADGFIAMPTEAIEMDLSFHAPKSDFRQLLSLIPNAYIAGYEQVKVDGRFELAGNVKGVYEGDRYPAFELKALIENGAVQYPDLPMGLGDIQTNIQVSSPQGDLDRMVIDIPTFRLRVGDNPISGRFALRTPLSDPDMDTEIKGTLDLEQLARAFPMEGIETLAGIIRADIEIKTRMSTIDRGDYEAVNMRGELDMQNIRYAAAPYPAMNFQSIQVAFTPQRVELNRFDAQLGKSDLKASGAIDNVLAYFTPNKTMTGQLSVQSNYFNADEWMEETAASSTAAAQPMGASPESVEAPFDRFDFALDAQLGKIDYDVYTLTNTSASGRFTPNRMTLSSMATQLGASDLRGSGEITGVWDYLFDNGTLGGQLQVASNTFDLNPFMVATEPATSTQEPTAYEPILIPGNIDMQIDARVDRLLYPGLELRDLVGSLVIADQEVMIESLRAKGLDGDIALSGSYNTQQPDKPAFTFKYDLSKLDFQKAFQAFNSFAALAPIGKYINGRFSSSLIMDGFLGQDMMPQFNSLSADGFLATINAYVQGFPPLNAVGEKLNLDYLKNLNLTDTKNWFAVKDGQVELKEFDYQVKDVEMKIGGTHGIASQQMNYNILARLPRKLLEQNPAGQAAASGLAQLRKEAGNMGINLAESEYVNVQINLTGSMTDPKVGLKLLGAGGASLAASAKEALKDEVEAGKEQLKQEAQKQVDAAKEQAKEAVTTAKDTITKAVTGKVEETKQEVKEQLNEQVKDLGKDTKEDIQKKLDDFNPLKKKKKKDGN